MVKRLLMIAFGIGLLAVCTSAVATGGPYWYSANISVTYGYSTRYYNVLLGLYQGCVGQTPEMSPYECAVGIVYDLHCDRSSCSLRV
jgi:hypothetical protein